MEIFPYDAIISAEDRHVLNAHRSGLLWLTGLSGSGKSTLAHAVEARLYEIGVRSYVLDGDNIRCGLNKDLGLSPEDRKENIRRVAEVAKLMVDAGILVFAAFITLYLSLLLVMRSFGKEDIEILKYMERKLGIRIGILRRIIKRFV